MQAMVMHQPGHPLVLSEVPPPRPGPHQVLLQVHACGVCRTDLHIIDGELPHPLRPLIPGHQIVGTVVEKGSLVTLIEEGARVGVPWLGSTCGSCHDCATERENLCDKAQFTGYQLQGGFAEFTVADERYCFPIPAEYPDLQAAPLLCAGLIGYRSLAKVAQARNLGFFGFGAAAHLLIQVARYQGQNVYAFTRPGDHAGQTFAKSLGAVWAGSSQQMPPLLLDAAIIFAPVGELVVTALKVVDKGGTVVCAGIHMSDIPSFPYSILWEERTLCSVANLTRKDGEAFLRLAPQIPLRSTVTTFPLARANHALSALREGRLEGAAVVTIGAKV
jgi:propanol-preferring alcohol dehydrogenase